MNRLAKTKAFVQRHQAKILLTTTIASTTVVVLQGQGIKSLNEFLKEKGLFDEYYDLTAEL